MIPIKLTLEGLYSYQERQVIYFEHLIEAGLFGIFGSVGSGKSSILEAISFGLYGETERLNSKDNRAYNMMNLKSNRSVIDFEFYNFEDKKYRIYREFSRNSKRFEDVKRKEAVLYKWEKEQWIPLDHTNVEKIIGLSYENFKRTIIIPQGKFKEFIELGGTARTKMMQEIFGLGRFDLAEQTRHLFVKNKEQLDRLEGNLQGFESINAEGIEEQYKALNLAKDICDVRSKEFKFENEVYLRLKNTKDDFDELQKKKELFVKFIEKQKTIEQQENDLAKYELIEKLFRMPLLELHNIQTRKLQKETQLQAETNTLHKTTTEYKKINEQLSALQPLFEGLEKSKRELFELELIQQIVKAKKQIQISSVRTEKGKSLVEEYQKKQKEEEIILEEKLKTLKSFKNNQLKSDVLFEIEKWFFEKNRFLNQIATDKKRIFDVSEKITSIEEEVLQFRFGTLDWEKEILERRVQIKKELEQLQYVKNKLEVTQKLTHFAEELHDGEACPLCGALEHPQVAVMEDVSHKIEEFQTAILKQEEKAEHLSKVEREMNAISERKQMYVQQYEELNENIILLESNLSNHIKGFSWDGFDRNNETDFQDKKSKANALHKQIELEENGVEQQRKKIDNLRNDVEKFKSELDKIQKQELEWLMQIQTNEKQLKNLSIVDFEGDTEESLTKQQSELALKISDVEQKYKSLTVSLSEITPHLASQKTIVSTLEKDISELQQQDLQIQETIELLLRRHQLERIEVAEVLSKNIDVSKIREEIQVFHIQFATLKNSIDALQEKVGVSAFDEQFFISQEEKVKILETQLKEATETVASLKSEADRLEKEFEKKKTLLEEHDKLQKRAINIQTMSNLFKASGFVNYVSAIYLHNLCEMANVRFHRLTKNQLSLQLNDANEFEIIDYLNNGKPRSVKTLSGGQSFQVSLSLALALAESVQSLSKSDKNFFFIDEGFGTQDVESVNIVFETLNNLHKENRIVGIISHVEELQERIPISITVEKDEERGSILQANY